MADFPRPATSGREQQHNFARLLTNRIQPVNRELRRQQKREKKRGKEEGRASRRAGMAGARANDPPFPLFLASPEFTAPSRRYPQQCASCSKRRKRKGRKRKEGRKRRYSMPRRARPRCSRRERNTFPTPRAYITRSANRRLRRRTRHEEKRRERRRKGRVNTSSA